MAEILLINRPDTTGGRLNIIRPTYWYGMTFTPAQDCSLTKVDVYGYKDGSPPEPFRVAIYNVDGSHHPTGSPIDTCLINASEFSTSFAWILGKTFTNGVQLTNGTEYAVVFETDGGDATNDYQIYEKIVTWYGLTSYNGGSTWSTDTYLKTLKLYGDTYTFSPPEGKATKKRLVAAAESTFYYESIA